MLVIDLELLLLLLDMLLHMSVIGFRSTTDQDATGPLTATPAASMDGSYRGTRSFSLSKSLAPLPFFSAEMFIPEIPVLTTITQLRLQYPLGFCKPEYPNDLPKQSNKPSKLLKRKKHAKTCKRLADHV